MKTLAQIRAKVRYLIDETNDTTPVTWQNAELTEYINDGQIFVLSEMVKVNPDYSLARATASMVASQSAYVMPADLFANKFRGIWRYSPTAGPRVELKYASNDTIMALQHILGAPAYYTFIDPSLVLGPVPDAVYTMEMWYTARPTTLSGDGDNCWFKDEEVAAVEAWAAIKALNRIDRDATKVIKILDSVLSQIKANITPDDNLTMEYAPLDMS
jgi:hypothetical protein